ncbi:MAG: metallopeptidase TldD-related protein [Candidatus Paceibacterota bacterium]|jgi:predicted Zn-dependent protease|nr:metallopeptidase TldD-related protein [Candidatus Paceibacterota bacterium]
MSEDPKNPVTEPEKKEEQPKKPAKQLQEKKLPEKAKKQESPNEYGPLAGPFAESCDNVIEDLDAKGAREIKYTSAYVTFRYGAVCQTDANGTVGMTFTTKEHDAKTGKEIKQAFTIGTRTEAHTLAREIASASLKARTMPKKFTVKAKVDQLLQQVIPLAQKTADGVQKKIDRENFKVFPLYFEDAKKASVDVDSQAKPDLEMVANLTSHAYSVVAQELGAQVSELKTLCAKFTDGMVTSDSRGTEIDALIPRMRLVIQVKTINGSEAFGAIGGSSGTFLEILSRGVPEKEDVAPEDLAKNPLITSKDPFDIVTRLAKRVAKEALNLDRAEGSSILGKEGYVILSAQAAAVFAHEVIGHPQEGDILIENKNNANAKVKLMGTMGARVSDHPHFNVFETAEPNFDVGKRKVKYSWGAMPMFDEYGVECKKVSLIEAGQKVGALNNHYTLEEVASSIDAKLGERMRKDGLSGRSRSESFDKIPQVRMTTTVIVPDEDGPNSVQRMAALIPKNVKGVYIKSINGGWVNTENGDFMLDGMLCFLIENGMITEKPLKGIKVQDNITRFQEKIVAIGSSETAKYPFTGYCGKGLDGKGNQWVPVEAFAPAILLQKIVFAGGSITAWPRIVASYTNEHKKVLRGQKTAEQVFIPEIGEFLEPGASQAGVCLVTSCFSVEGEWDYVLGKGVDTSTHKVSKKDENKLIKRGDTYDS